ncbi:hypothetical protein POVCU1_083440 [Plasmodium ovale curtisi]|uniref:PIR Superfamily Protein n=1 Tax=Plasmodium ovale curtisi TaxID=864141 RepID=A0A1A8XE69_PLAOA|nr:hypothetical protein POVCU1_083440 [Plasmodium ovale curtisi]
MPLEIQTIYNAATLNDKYREKLNSLKNHRKTQNINGCREFTNQYLNIEAFGPWMRQLVFKNRNVLDNINEDINDSLQIYERENDYSKTRGYNIAYSS